MDLVDRERTIQYFERLGEKRVRLYTQVDCERYLGGWQVRELAEEWLAQKAAEARGMPFWRRLMRAR